MASKLAALALLLAFFGCVAHTGQASYGYPYPLSAPKQSSPPAAPRLNYAHYYKTCKGAEKIVRDVVQEEIKRKRDIGAGLIRLFFHDCFVQVYIVGYKHIDLLFVSLLTFLLSMCSQM
jgi:peroxidase